MADADRLVQAGQALGLPLSDAEVAQLLRYRDGLLHWNRVYNLTAIRDPQEALRQHVIDCLAVVPAIRRGVAAVGKAAALRGEESDTGARPVREVLDVGSGGGLPGLILAILEPTWRVDCIDAVGKKAAFIRQIAAELGLPRVRSLHARVEAHAADPRSARYAVITSRAFASLGDFVGLTRPALAPCGVWAAMKGQRPDDEIAALPADVRVFHVEHQHAPGADQQRCLVWLHPATEPPPDLGVPAA